MRKFIIITLLFCGGLTVFAQQNTTEKMEINRIKKSPSYIFSDVTRATIQEAKDAAEEMLYDNINKWIDLQQKKGNKIILKDSKSLWKIITVPRGNMFRAFYYIGKDELASSDNSVKSEISTHNKENVLSDSSSSISKQNIGTEYIIKADEDRDVDYKDVFTVNNEALKEIISLEQFSQLRKCLTNLKSRGLVLDYNTYSSLKKKEDYYLIIYNREGIIEAVLSDGEQRINIKTGNPDGTENYPGRGALGFKLKNK